ncbi:MAG: PIN domain-containing protein [Eubacteriales bacterium]|nr:PIN domain-containing protein [Eubacteriales bacterium]
MIFFQGRRFLQMVEYITQKHTLILSSFVIEELLAVADRKFPEKKDAIDRFLAELTYELVYTPINMPAGLFTIRDMNDYPVLYTAIIEDVDILVTGDKDFADILFERPEILTPAAFMEKYLD